MEAHGHVGVTNVLLGLGTSGSKSPDIFCDLKYLKVSVREILETWRALAVVSCHGAADVEFKYIYTYIYIYIYIYICMYMLYYINKKYISPKK